MAGVTMRVEISGQRAWTGSRTTYSCASAKPLACAGGLLASRNCGELATDARAGVVAPIATSSCSASGLAMNLRNSQATLGFLVVAPAAQPEPPPPVPRLLALPTGKVATSHLKAVMVLYWLTDDGLLIIIPTRPVANRSKPPSSDSISGRGATPCLCIRS